MVQLRTSAAAHHAHDHHQPLQAPRVPPGSSPSSVLQGAGERMGGSSVNAFELRAAGGNEKPSW